MNLYANESTVSERDDGTRVGLGDSGIYETFAETTGELYRSCLKEYGRCTGRVYVDTDDGTQAIGWVFVARRPFEDDPSQSSLVETWVTVHDAPDTVTREHHYHAFSV